VSCIPANHRLEVVGGRPRKASVEEM